MPTLTGYYPRGGLSLGGRGIGSDANGYDANDWLGFVRTWDRTHSPKHGEVSSNLPVTTTARAISGHIAKSYLDDFYNRVHLTPRAIDAGTLLATKTYQIGVWNAYLDPINLLAIGRSGTSGITDSGVAAPSVFSPLEEATLTLIVTPSGPVSIDATYTFSFDVASVQTHVTGRRGVVWGYVPQVPFRESLEWKTDVISSFSAEQRIALRVAPRQTFSNDYRINSAQLTEAKGKASRSVHQPFGIPVWTEATYVGAIPQGATEILFDTSNADYRADDLMYVWESDSKSGALATVTKLPDRITLLNPTGVGYTAAYVMPMRLMYALNGIGFERGPSDSVHVRGEFMSDLSVDLGDNGAYPQYRGKTVLPFRPFIVTSGAEKVLRATTVFDNESGPIDVDPVNSWVSGTSNVGFEIGSKSERWTVRRWLHSLRGRQKAFWLPTWNRDLTLVLDAGPSAQGITVSSVGYADYYTVKDLMVRLKNGTVRYLRVLSSVNNGDGTETLALDTVLGTELLVADVEFISFMDHVRLASDRVDIRHYDSDKSSVSIPVVETPE